MTFIKIFGKSGNTVRFNGEHKWVMDYLKTHNSWVSGKYVDEVEKQKVRPFTQQDSGATLKNESPEGAGIFVQQTVIAQCDIQFRTLTWRGIQRKTAPITKVIDAQSRHDHRTIGEMISIVSRDKGTNVAKVAVITSTWYRDDQGNDSQVTVKVLILQSPKNSSILEVVEGEKSPTSTTLQQKWAIGLLIPLVMAFGVVLFLIADDVNLSALIKGDHWQRTVSSDGDGVLYVLNSNTGRECGILLSLDGNIVLGAKDNDTIEALVWTEEERLRSGSNLFSAPKEKELRLAKVACAPSAPLLPQTIKERLKLTGFDQLLGLAPSIQAPQSEGQGGLQ